ncbi:CS1-pili formation C-terminal domain-containing protein [Morganella morganii]|nr:hypothetical protein [Morganella morganii]
MSRRVNRVFAAFIASGIITIIPTLSYAVSENPPITRFGNIVIPEAFSNALRDGMSIPLFIHLDGNTSKNSDERIGTAFIRLEDGSLKIRTIQPDSNDENSLLNAESRKYLSELNEQALDNDLRLNISDDVWLQLDLKQLHLQLAVKHTALGTVMQPRSTDIGESSVKELSGTLRYDLGAYNNRSRSGGNSTSSYLSLDSVTSLLEHHLILNGSFYGIGSNRQTGTLYKAMYERDFSGFRLALGLLDSWSLQSLGPVTAIPSGKIIGLSWGNQANSTILDTNQSINPIIVFLPAPGEVYLYREGRLLSIQNFGIGNHEVDTRGLPYGNYDIEVEVMANNTLVDKRIRRVNKLFTSHGAGAPFTWQFWGGNLKMDKTLTFRDDDDTDEAHQAYTETPAENTPLAGVSASGSFGVFSWAATVYHYDKNTVAETRASLPIADDITISLQNMVADDGSWSGIAGISATLPGGFTSVWATQEKNRIGKKLHLTDVDNLSVGATLNFSAVWQPSGTLTTSYNRDRKNGSHYYNYDYNQNLYTGEWGNLSMRAGVQRYSNADNINTGKYISFDFSLPLGNWFSAGMTHQRGYTLANISARKTFDEGAIRTIGINASRAVNGDTRDDKTLSGGVYTQFETRHTRGSVNVNSGADGYINTNLTAGGTAGWNGMNIAASGRNDGNAGIIFNTGIDNDGSLSANVNGMIVDLKNGRNYLPLSPYGQYNVAITNSKKSTASYNIATNRKTQVTLYPGNVAVVSPEIKQMVTVFGRIRAEDGSLIANAHINNHIGRTKTNNSGEFVMDIDKQHPTIDFSYANNQRCEIELNLTDSKGAIWVGDVTCTGLKSYADTASTGAYYEG